MNKTLQLDISHSSTTEAVGGRKSVSAQITTNQQVEPERNSVSAPEPEFYKHGADSPVPEFDPRKIPFCLYCDEVKVPLTKIPRTPEDPAHYALDTYCSDDCEEAHRVERKQAKDDVYAAAIAEMRTAGRNVL